MRNLQIGAQTQKGLVVKIRLSPSKMLRSCRAWAALGIVFAIVQGCNCPQCPPAKEPKGYEVDIPYSAELENKCCGTPTSVKKWVKKTGPLRLRCEPASSCG
jgi:hypothetical protein